MSNIQTILGNNIRQLRLQKGWSQIFLADKLEVSDSFISVIESGRRGISLSLVEDIAIAFNVPIPFLFTDHDAQNSDSANPIHIAKLESELKEGITAYLADFFAKKKKTSISQSNT